MKYLFSVIVAFSTIVVFGQNGNANIVNNNTTLETLTNRAGYLSSLATNGSPYIYPEYKKARIANNSALVDMRYNAYKDEVEIINNGKNMTIYKRPEYSPIHIIDNDEYIYLMDYPYNGKTVNGYLFEVQKKADCIVYMKISKSYENGKYAKDTFDVERPNAYEDVPDVFYFQKTGGPILEIPKTKKKLIEMFPDKKDKIEANLPSNKIETKSVNGVSQLLKALL